LSGARFVGPHVQPRQLGVSAVRTRPRGRPADRAGDTGAVHAAIPAGVLVQLLLVV